MVQVEIDDVEDMLGYEFRLQWNPDVLEFANYVPNEPFIYPLPTSIEPGQADVAWMYFPGEPDGLDLTDPYPVGSFIFSVVGSGYSELDLKNTKIVNVFAEEIEHVVLDGYFINVAPNPIADFTAWKAKAEYRPNWDTSDDPTNTLRARVWNKGTVGLSVKVVFTITKDAGRYALDFATFISSAYLGEAIQPATPAIKGLTFNWEELGKTPWAYDLAKVKTELQAAWEGQAWSTGFTVQIVYNEGNVARETAAIMMRDAILSIDYSPDGTVPTVTTHGLPWGASFIPGFLKMELPIWMVGWLADYADAHNFIAPYMHPEGDFSYFQSVIYGQSGHNQTDSLKDPDSATIVAIPFGTNGTSIDNSYMMDLIALGIEKPLYAERRAIYNEIQDIWLVEYVGIAITQPTVRHWERDWVQGYYFNSLSPGTYFRHEWKGLDADITGDDYVDISDAGKISAHWYSPPFPAGPLGYNRDADIYPLIELDGSDYLIEGTDGKVNILDASLINAEWHDRAQ